MVESRYSGRMYDFLYSLLPPYFEVWHLPLVFLVGVIAEGYGTVVGSGGILIQFVLASLGMPLTSVVATDIAGAMGANVGVIAALPRNIWSNRKLLILLAVPLLLGGVIGTLFLIYIPVSIFRYILIAALVFLLVNMFLKKQTILQPIASLNIDLRHYPLLFGWMCVLGVYGNMIGVGVGTFKKLSFVSLFRLSFADSLGMSNIIDLPAALFSFGATAFLGLIAWPYMLVLWLGTFLGAHHVTRYIRKIPNRYLNAALILITLLYLVYLLVSL